MRSKQIHSLSISPCVAPETHPPYTLCHVLTVHVRVTLNVVSSSGLHPFATAVDPSLKTEKATIFSMIDTLLCELDIV